jgi:hypothetical protein
MVGRQLDLTVETVESGCASIDWLTNLFGPDCTLLVGQSQMGVS